jgi:hypothetical protein
MTVLSDHRPPDAAAAAPPPTVETGDAVLGGLVEDLARELRAIVGGPRLRMIGTLAVEAEDGRCRPCEAGGITPTTGRLIAEALAVDPLFGRLFALCEAAARAAVARCGHRDAASTRFRFVHGEGRGTASLTDASGRTLYSWPVRLPDRLVAAE